MINKLEELRERIEQLNNNWSHAFSVKNMNYWNPSYTVSGRDMRVSKMALLHYIDNDIRKLNENDTSFTQSDARYWNMIHKILT